MRQRLSRAEQNDRNRALLLSAALRVFLARGYHAATLEQIADEAGFSKGAVYSRFESKADMFLALLTDRIAERAAENASAVADLTSSGTVANLSELAWQAERATPGWRLLVTEFRVLAARDPALNSRYAVAHATTVDAIASVLSAMSERDGIRLAVPARRLAELLLALETGIALEQLASTDAIDIRQVLVVLRQLAELSAGPADVISQEVKRS
ncbi:MAG: TetR/AcrR family transcriptional regulator [Nocardiopsaceae bacterium]|jgi:AcrR family transcriptional regulator|nr:TetR/AcrR family transcriptional regulator [Nocardiopsaceae bacterium]